jgi:drug/metabolite transporter (DMT)-like permease
MAFAATALVIWGAQYTIQKYAYRLEGAHEAFMALCSIIGGTFTLGVYGFLFGRLSRNGVPLRERAREWTRSLAPMGMMAGGDLGVIVASRYGPASIVTPLTGAYPIVTIAFAAVALKERITLLQYTGIGAVLVGMYLAT